ncbi:adenosylcobalamin-dependent ribonucleoside-diphosphate reductase [Candidatus Woesearchaeota archaeon]|nr:adenosylcobalamin-dependent ribonucleoside-diphosphate reductase [Candidatus Woesearchaeota archaeon]
MQIHHTIQKVVKRNGTIVHFDPEKIHTALTKALISTGETAVDEAVTLTKQVVREIDKNFYQPTVEQVQDVVERVLMSNGLAVTAKSYILYREKRKEARDERKQLLDGMESQLKLCVNSLLLLRSRYLRTEGGKLLETPEQLFTRVAKSIASVDKQYKQDPHASQEQFYHVMSTLKFLPNSSALMHAGTKHQQLFAIYALPIHDSVEDIFNAAKYQAIIQQSGAGTGFNFSKIRPRSSTVRDQPGIAAGPIQLMKVFDHVADSILQGGKRQGANMGILRVDHPDILQFISLKQDGIALKNFNISVGLTEKFMNAVEKGEDFTLRHPTTRKPVQTIPARHIFDLLILNAWRNGDPGILFLDRIHYSRSNPLIGKEQLCATSPCGEQPLYPYEGAILGSINVSRFVSNDSIDWADLKKTVHTAVHFLDNAIDANQYPLPASEVICKQNRRIGLGIMGFADLLFQLRIPFDSNEGVALAEKLMRFISENADAASRTLAQLRGPFPHFERSIYQHGQIIRNASRTTISPTGSLSIIAGCSSSVEAVFSLSYTMRMLGDKDVLITNPYFERALQQQGLRTKELMKQASTSVSIQNIDAIPDDIKKIFKVSYDISPEWQVKMQAAFQKYTDNCISKTVNFPSWATTSDVADVFFLAYKLGCKGITIYRDKSKEDQVIGVNIQKKTPPGELQEKYYCPECEEPLDEQENTLTCKECGFSRSRV